MNRFLAACLASALLSSLSACGGSRLEAKTTAAQLAERDAQSLEGGAMAPPVESVARPVTHLERDDVVATVDAGLGRFLQHLEMEASLTPSGEFAGFRIVRIVNSDMFDGVGIGAGDIVTRINDQPIERPMEAYETFVALKTADSLDVDYVRGGRLMRLSLPIVDDSEAEAARKTPSKEAAP